MSKKNKNRSKKQSSYSKRLSQSSVRGEYSTLEVILKSNTLDNIDKKFNNLKINKHILASIKDMRPKNMEDIYRNKLPFVSFQKTLLWISKILDSHHNQLNYFYFKERDINSCVLREEWGEALDIISEIDDLCGTSLLMLKLKSTIYKNSDREKIEGESKLVSYIVDKNNVLSRDYKIFSISEKNFIQEIVKSSLDKDLKSIVLYHLFSLDLGLDYDFSRVLKLEKETSILDLYNYFNLYTLMMLKESGSSSESLKSYNYFVPKKLRSNELATLQSVVKSSYSDLEVSSSFISNLFYDESFEELYFYALEKGLDTLSFNDFLYVAKSYVHLEVDLVSGFVGRLLGSLKDILQRNERYKDSRQYLLSVSYDYRSLKWFRDLNLFLKINSEFITDDEKEIYERMYKFSLDGLCPEKVSILPIEERKECYGILKHHDSYGLCGTFNEAISFGLKKSSTKGLKGFHKGYCEGVYKFNNKDYMGASSIFKGLTLLDGRYRTIEAETWLVKSLILNKEYDRAIDIFISTYLAKREDASRHDVEFIIREISDSYKKSLNINYPIIFSIYSSEVSRQYDARLRYSLERFIYNNGCLGPNEFFGKEGFDSERLNYLFKYVFTRENMKMFICFETNKEIEMCRSDICSYLIKNGDDSSYIAGELKEIEKIRLLNKAKKSVETSRIYVDTSVFYGRDSKPFRALFDRYVDLSKVSNKDEDDLHKIYEVLNEGLGKGGLINDSYLSQFEVLGAKLSEKDLTFLSLIKLIREEFVHGEKGLNNHLSSRIRHGVLPTNFKEPLLNENLYIDQSVLFSDYGISTLNALLKNFDFGVKEDVFNLIKDFSKKYESIINKINDVYLQVDTFSEGEYKNISVGSDNRLFNYSVTSLESYAIQEQLPISPSYDEFVKTVLDWLWEKTETNLNAVRGKIRGEGCRQMLELLSSLRGSIILLDNKGMASLDLINAIDRSRQNLLVKIEFISSWFKRYDQSLDEIFDLSDSISVASRSLGLNINSDYNCLEVKISSKALLYFVDIFSILFENAISKSGLVKSDLNVRVIVNTAELGDLSLSVINDCSSKAIDPDVLMFYQDAYGMEDLVNEAVSNEGGTGFFKIWKLLKKDLNISHQAKFYFNEGSFVMNLLIKKSDGMEWYENTNN